MNFDRLAHHYDWMETVTAGSQLQQVRTCWLDALAGCRRILSVGEGHGRFAAACAERFPDAELTCVEASPAMIAVAQRRLAGKTHRVTWECRDITTWYPVRPYDAVITNFFLDCFPPGALAATVAHLGACASDRAIWLVSDFALPRAGLPRWRAQAIHAVMYGFFRRIVGLPARRLTEPDAALSCSGFTRIGRREFDWGLLRADVWRREPALLP